MSCLQQGVLAVRKPVWSTVWLFFAITLGVVSVLSCLELAATCHPTLQSGKVRSRSWACLRSEERVETASLSSAQRGSLTLKQSQAGAHQAFMDSRPSDTCVGIGVHVSTWV